MMPTPVPFDAKKALREEMQGLSEVLTTLVHRERQAQRTATEAEAELNAITKLRGFAQAELDRKRSVLRQLEEDQ